MAAMAPTVLPAATTYLRRWKRTDSLIVPYWFQTSRQSFIVDAGYQCLMEKLYETKILHSFTWEPPQADVDALLHRYPLPERTIIIENFTAHSASNEPMLNI